jgi:hypothetical protein
MVRSSARVTMRAWRIEERDPNAREFCRTLNMSYIVRALVAAALVGLLGGYRAATAQELSLLVGAQHTNSLDEKTYAFSYEYQQNLSENFYATFTWLNEGHVTNHHRDGHALQIWYRWLTPSRRFSFSGGVGPYRYYDTTSLSGDMGDQSTDEHGYGVMLSAAAKWYIRHPWVLELRYNYVRTSTSITTNTLLMGVAYEFESSTRDGPVVPPPSYGFSGDERQEVTLMLGKSVLNNFHSPEGAAWGIEYRRLLTPFIDVTGTFLDEGDNGVQKRRGLAVSGVLSREFLSRRAFVGLGLGPYLARTTDESGDHTKVLGLLTMIAGWHWNERWSTRAYWYRTVTDNGTDTDVVTVGMGYSF